MTLSADDIIKLLDLKPLRGEGGFYTEPYRTTEHIPVTALPPRYAKQADKPFSTAIYYFLTPETCSALHRLLTDEVYHFYLGDPVTMLWLKPGGASEVLTLGQDIMAEQRVQVVAPRGVWQGSFLQEGGRFALMGTTMAPGFDFDDYEGGEREALTALYPDRAGLIARLTPPFDD